MLNRAPLVQALAALQVTDAAPAGPLHLGERCSAWLAWTDDIALAAVINRGAPGPQQRATPPMPQPGADTGASRLNTAGSATGAAATWGQAVERLRADLARAIDTDPQFHPAQPQATRATTDVAPTRRPAAAPAPTAADRVAPAVAATVGDSASDRADFAPWRQRCAAHQRAMDSRIAALRAPLRAALAARTPALARLAALDAVLEQALAERQRHLLGTVPGWLEKHHRSHQPGPAALGAQVRAVLCAELDTRLLPLGGLVEALEGVRPGAGPGARP